MQKLLSLSIIIYVIILIVIGSVDRTYDQRLLGLEDEITVTERSADSLRILKESMDTTQAGQKEKLEAASVKVESASEALYSERNEIRDVKKHHIGNLRLIASALFLLLFVVLGFVRVVRKKKKKKK